jgi:acyl-coenzyme A synthetase/AMP-(fatty) acid ligase
VATQDSGADGRLAVTSPFVSTPGAPRFTMEDRVEFLGDGRFLLLGRADRTVKVGEKRVSLPDLEQRVRTHACVSDAALVLLEHPPEPRIGAVVVLSDEGRSLLARRGRRAVAAALRGHLRAHADPVALPRTWRYVEALPRDPQGKVSADALRALLRRSADPAPASVEILEDRRGADGCDRILRVPEGLAALDGHFP